MTVGKVLWRLFRFRPGVYLSMIGLRFLIFGAAPLCIGLVTRMIFDTLTDTAPATIGPLALCAVLIGIALARAVCIFTDIPMHTTFGFSTNALIRINIFDHILRTPRRPRAAGGYGRIGESSSG